MAKRALKAGAHAFLMKPFDDEALLASVAHAVTRAET
jgi:FixJ family two-component response regulator